jgi:protein-disulfide isomerase
VTFPFHFARIPTLLLYRILWTAAAVAACSAPESSSRPTGSSPAPSTAATAPIVAAHDSATLLGKADQGRIRGDTTAKLWVIMVSDFQCPFCRQWHDEVFATLTRDYVATGKVRLAYLNFPLSIHQNAVPAAEAAMCASVQGKFWEMHDAIFRAQDRWAELPDPRAVFDSLATSVGVAAGPYRACIASGATRPMIAADQQRASSAGVKATPTFFIGSDQIEGAVPLPEFRAALDKALAGTR